MSQQPITLIGGGLVGALLAQQLARRGFSVEVFEKRPDPRRATHSGASCARGTSPSLDVGRSINLALAERGLHALRSAGLADEVLRHAVMMRGRMVHDRAGNSSLQRYGVDDSEVIWSVSRNVLNTLLLDAAEAAGARFHFGQSLSGADFGRKSIQLTDPGGVHRQHPMGKLIGADGAGSSLRAAMQAHIPLGERIEALGHGYKELEIPPTDPRHPGNRHAPFALEPHALHIWPRGGYMCIALPNTEGSFTVTLFLPTHTLPTHETASSFAQLPDADSASVFFRAQFPDLLPLLPAFADDYDTHPVGSLSTLYLDRWHLGGDALLIGDAAHAIVPFHGQGMNCGFEDTVLLSHLLAGNADDSAGVFAEFQRIRQPDTDAIARMALENYVEMRDSVADPHYLARRELGALLAARAPRHYMARYRMVSFTHLPYAYALERGRAQDALLEQLLQDATCVAEVDLEAAQKQLERSLPPLPLQHHG
ncbi:MAG: FAD-dependent monooxygenase [Rhodanobacter sp.]|nr:MAG: FAD-dependent monooxygenase [Rhodanobacter sp.]